MNYEEITTVLTQIEAVLNSRPLYQSSDDPNEEAPLTPGHLLIGGPLNSPPDPPLNHLKENHLSRWQLVQKMGQHFWKRWAAEYLSTLQSKTKWLQAKNPVSVNDLVIIKEASETPFQWKIGRIIQVHPGKDGRNRIVEIKTSNGIVKRNITSLIKLNFSTPPAGPPSVSASTNDI